MAFGKGAMGKLFEGTVISEKFNERPMFYGAVAGTLVIMATPAGPWLIKSGYELAKNSTQLATEATGIVFGGIINSSRQIGNALVPVSKKKKTRATATRRRASRKR